jgi:serine/threonine protein kinase
LRASRFRHPRAIVAQFSIVEELHRSSGGTVYLGRHRPTGRSVVLKERHVSELGHGHGLDNEVAMYDRVPRHSNLIACLGSYKRSGRSRTTGGDVLVMVFEHATQGDLHRALLKQRSAGRYLSETQVLQWFVPIAAGVRHLHAHGIVHRDLKSLNIVLHDGVPKICDLGISRYRSEDTVFLKSFCGTPA